MTTRITRLSGPGVRVAVAGLALAAFSAVADSPHYILESATVTGATGDLVCSWKAAGLGSTVTDTFTCSADASATYACVTKSGSVPSSAKKTTVTGPVSTSGSLTVGIINGQAVGSIVLSAPSGINLACSNGQTLELAGTSYANVVISDAAGLMPATAIPGTFTSTCLLQNGC